MKDLSFGLRTRARWLPWADLPYRVFARTFSTARVAVVAA